MSRLNLYNYGMNRWEFCCGCEKENNCEVNGACWNCFCTELILEDCERNE